MLSWGATARENRRSSPYSPGCRQPDAGTVAFRGVPAPRLADRDGWRRVVACVYQRSTIIPGISVAENLFLNRPAPHARGGHQLEDAAPAGAGAAGRVGRGDRRRPPRVPTSASSSGRWWRSHARCRSARGSSSSTSPPPSSTPRRSSGCSAGSRPAGPRRLPALISHHLEEIYEVCQTVTVFRDAHRVLTARSRAADHQARRGHDGRDLRQLRRTGPQPRRRSTHEVLRVDGLSGPTSRTSPSPCSRGRSSASPGRAAADASPWRRPSSGSAAPPAGHRGRRPASPARQRAVGAGLGDRVRPPGPPPPGLRPDAQRRRERHHDDHPASGAGRLAQPLQA